MATLAVFGLPVLVVYLLSASGSVSGFVPLLATAMALSIAASSAGAAFWSTRFAAGDTVFGDLMLWGWAKRWRQERQLTSAVKLLDLREDSVGEAPGELSSRRRAQLLQRLAGALEARDPDTYGHSRRVARHAAAIAKGMGLPREEVARIRTAATVHDVGKIETPLEIMRKPGRLTDEEFATIKEHAAVGARMVAVLRDDELTQIVRHHHERLDGKGYPDGLAGSRIPLGARIVAVADTFDAVTSSRPYRPARKHREALALLSEEAGTQLDPAAVRAFRGYYSGLRPATLWALLLNGPRQLLSSLANELKLGGIGVTAKAAAATALTVAGAASLHSIEAGRGGTPVTGGGNAPASRHAALADGSPGSSSQPGGSQGHQPGGGSGEEATAPGAGEVPSSQPAGGGTAPAGGGDTTGSEGGPSPSGEGGSSPGAGGGSVTPPSTPTTPSTSQVTEPVNSAVGGVLETVETVVPVEVKASLPPIVDSVVSKLPVLGHGQQ